LLPAADCAVFVVLELWHIYMAMRPTGGASGAVPTVEGKPLFVPSRVSTIGVAAILFLFAVLVTATGDLLQLPVPAVALRWLSFGLAVGLLARAVGEFKYVGFFKRVRGSR